MKASHTLLAFLPRKTYLVHFSTKSLDSVFSVKVKEKSPEEDTVQAFENAIRGETLAKEVFILDSSLWCQEVFLKQQALSNLRETELKQALAFEAEFFSGISANDSEIAYQVLDQQEGQSVYWVLQTPKSALQRLSESVRKQKSRLAGVFHPGGLRSYAPSFLKNGNAQNWQRVELWPECVVCLQNLRGQKRLHLLNIAPQLGNWRPEAEKWFGGAASSTPTHYITSHSEWNNLPSNLTVYLEEEKYAHEWLKSWCKQLTQAHSAIPKLAPFSVKTTSALERQGSSFLSSAFFVLLLAALGAHYFYHSQQVEQKSKQWSMMQGKINTQKEQEKKLEVIQNRIEQLKTDLQNKTLELKIVEEVFQTQKQKYVHLINELADQVPANVSLQEIRAKQQQFFIRGVCLEPGLVDDYVLKLKEKLHDQGWIISPAIKNALEEIPAWNFEIALQPRYPALPTRSDPRKQRLQNAQTALKNTSGREIR
jgi:Tfp pilus assembly protein PilN